MRVLIFGRVQIRARRRNGGGRFARCAALPTALLCAMMAGCLLFPPMVKRESLLVPLVQGGGDREAEGQYVLQEDGIVYWELSGLRVEVKHISDEELNQIFPDESARGKYSTNPYTYGDWIDTRLGYTPNRFTVFKVKIFNRTFPRVRLNPLEAEVQTDQGQLLRAYGITSASPHENFENYYRSRRGQSGNEFYRFELRMGTVRSYNYEEDQPIFKTENYGGFIVFDPVYPETEEVVLTLKNFVLRFGAFDKPTETRDLRFRFKHRVEERVVARGAGVSQTREQLLVSEKGPRQILGNLPGDRTRDAGAIQAFVRQRLAAINRCFVQEFDRGEAQMGQIVARFTIEVGGPISEVRITESTVKSEAVGQCVEEEILRWGFRPVDVAALQAAVSGRSGGFEPEGEGAGGQQTVRQVTPLPVVVVYPFNFGMSGP